MKMNSPIQMLSVAGRLALLLPVVVLAAPPTATPAFDTAAEAGLSAKQKKELTRVRGGNGVKHVHTVRIKPGLDKKTTKSDRVQFEVGPGKTVEQRFHHIDKRPDGYTWHGGDPRGMSHSTIVVHGNDMVGTIRENGQLYRIESAGEGVQQVIEVDESKIQMESAADRQRIGHNAVPVSEPVAEQGEAPLHHAATPAAGSSDPRIYLSESPPPPTTTIDLLVVYTQKAWEETANAIEWGTIPLCISETNTAFSNSGASSVAVKSVKIAKVNYTEVDIKTDLKRLYTAGDGYMDDVFTLRDQNKADGVILITGNYSGASCGLAPLNSGLWADYGFAVIGNSCATGIYGFAHELGHTMGMKHDVYQEKKDGQAISGYNYGYVKKGLYRTIMAYGAECTDVSLQCAPIMYFSNPSISYLLTSTGNASANNAKVLLDNAAKYAAFR